MSTAVRNFLGVLALLTLAAGSARAGDACQGASAKLLRRQQPALLSGALLPKAAALPAAVSVLLVS